MNLLTDFELLLHELLSIDILEERMNRVVSFLQRDIGSLSSGIFLSHNSEYRLKIGRNISHTYTKNTVFHDEDSFVKELIKNKFLSLRDETCRRFEHDCRHILVHLLKVHNEVFGFIFTDKEAAYFTPEEESYFRIVAEITSLLFALNKLTVFWQDKKELDEETHIYRYKTFMEKGTYLFKLLHRTSIKLSVAVVKINKYNELVKVHGRQKTVILVQELLALIQKNVRPIDIPGKMFDDTYALLFPNLNSRQTRNLVEKVHQEIESREDLSEGDINWGIAGMEKESAGFEKLLSDAEEAAFDSSREESVSIVVYNE